jgi:hypothetical protein
MAEIAAAIAHGALLGARGNSGVILSQILRGFSEAVSAETTIDGAILARALDCAQRLAYGAVMKPVEGTMLSVIRSAAEAAATLSAANASAATVAAVLAAALAGAEEALARTPEMLDILRQAGVVDAGGQGLVHLLAGMGGDARGERVIETEILAVSPVALLPYLDRVAALHPHEGFGYCTNFVVVGEHLDVARCRAELAAMGDSAVIVGDEHVLKVHLHTLHPGRALEYGLRLGELDQVKIDNMQAQLRTRQEVGQTTALPPAANALPVSAVANVAVVAVAAGDGLAAALRSLGAAAIVPGGQTMNPSVAELVAAITTIDSATVIVLPNNPNVILTALQVGALVDQPVAVVQTRSLPQGLAGLAAFNPAAPLAVNQARMSAAISTVKTVEVTYATRDTIVHGILVTAGQAIGLLDDRVVAAGDDLVTVTLAAIERAEIARAELVTIFASDHGTLDLARTVAEAIGAAHPHLVIEYHIGGQPHYPFIIAIE